MKLIDHSTKKFTLSKLAISALSVAALLTLSACGGSSSSTDNTQKEPVINTPDDPNGETPNNPNGETPDTPKEKTIIPVEIPFTAVAKNTSGSLAVVNCTDSYVLGKPDTSTTIADLRFYIQDAYVLAKDGKQLPITLTPSDWQQTDVALIDLEDGTGNCEGRGTTQTNNKIIGQIESTYTKDNFIGVGFTVGVPDEKNHSFWSGESTAAPLDIQAMSWSWQGGRKFTKIELKPEGGMLNVKDGATKPMFMLHLGKAGCDPEASGGGAADKGEEVKCTHNNKFAVGFVADTLENKVVQLDLGKLYAGSDITKNEGGAPGCMSFAEDPECPAIFKTMGLDFATSEQVAEQQIFSLVDK